MSVVLFALSLSLSLSDGLLSSITFSAHSPQSGQAKGSE